MAKLFTQRKGQSAIEYLTTYGWMLLVIAIVGGAIFTTVQNTSDVQATSGFNGQDVDVTNYGITDAGFQMELRGQAAERVSNVSVTLYQDGASADSTNKVDLGVGETDTVDFSDADVDSTQTSNEITVEVTYNSGDLTGLTFNGTLTGEYQVS